MRDASIAVLREIGVDTGGSNVQFARQSPRPAPGGDRDEPAGVALLGAGLQGDRLSDRQDRRQAGGRLHPRRARQRHHRASTPASFEPTIDYVVTKMPRFTFEKFPAPTPLLTTSDEVGRRGHGDRPTFKESCRRRCAPWRPATGLDEIEDSRPGRSGLRRSARSSSGGDRHERAGAAAPSPSLRRGMDAYEELYALTGSTPGSWRRSRRSWWIEESGSPTALPERARRWLRRLKQAWAFSDQRLAALTGLRGGRGARLRTALGVRAGLQAGRHLCAASSRRITPYMYSTYRRGRVRGRAEPTADKIMILGGGPNRIGQGIEFDYCCVHAVSPCARRASRRSWSTATRRRCRPTTTPRTGSTSSR